jgi:rhodanese-related sulfurtransferase
LKPRLNSKLVLQDLISVWVLLTGCLMAGVVLNEMRPVPMQLVYSSPASRLNQTVAQMETSGPVGLALDGDISRDEVKKATLDHAALILDARPEIFYRLGHIPSALSLPRDDFEKQYHSIQETLQSHRQQPFIVYCSESSCQDSQMVADALLKLGYPHIRVFRGGWGDWESANLPEEKN